MPEATKIPATGLLPYQVYTVTISVPEDAWVRGVVIRAGHAKVVHHCLIFINYPDTAKYLEPKQEQAAAGFFAGYVPGTEPVFFPPGTAKSLPKGAEFLFPDALFQVSVTTVQVFGRLVLASSFGERHPVKHSALRPHPDSRPHHSPLTLAGMKATATFGVVTGTAINVNEATEQRKARAGLGYGLAAYTMWGVFPIYFRALTHVSPWVILGHRILWSAVFLSVIVSIRREWPLLLPVVRQRRNLLLLAAGGVLIAVNWLVFIHAVVTGQVLESSLGYFINPLFSVALGMVFLHERLRRWQWVAVAIAGMAVTNLTFRGERIPWIALSLAGSFGLYGLVRKKVDINTLHGLLVETTVLLPVALVGLMSLPMSQPSTGTLGLLAFLGVITATPLLLFGAAVRRLPLSTIGFLQYVGPTLQFLVAILLFREPLDHAKLVSFGLCWAAIAVYVADSVRTHTAQPVADRPE